MTLAERLRDAAGPYNDAVLVYVESKMLLEAAARIEAADAVACELPGEWRLAAMLASGMGERELHEAVSAYRALVREQEVTDA